MQYFEDRRISILCSALTSFMLFVGYIFSYFATVNSGNFGTLEFKYMYIYVIGNSSLFLFIFIGFRLLLYKIGDHRIRRIVKIRVFYLFLVSTMLLFVSYFFNKFEIISVLIILQIYFFSIFVLFYLLHADYCKYSYIKYVRCASGCEQDDLQGGAFPVSKIEKEKFGRFHKISASIFYWWVG